MTQSIETWEERFHKKFYKSSGMKQVVDKVGRRKSLSAGKSYQYNTRDIKSFIHSEINKAKEESYKNGLLRALVQIEISVDRKEAFEVVQELYFTALTDSQDKDL